MDTLKVALGDRAYPIYIGQGILCRFDLLRLHIAQPSVAVVTNTTLAPRYLPSLTALLRSEGIGVAEIVLPDGEEYKDWKTLNAVFDALLERGCERGTTLIALGGGVIGDITGFAAACYQRGAPFIQIPTTLLAQVDSSVGGKTAINHPRGKNMIGAFYQPKAVFIDTDALGTLPEREFRAGMAEVIKYGLIRDLPFLEWLEENLERLLGRDTDALQYAIRRSCANKAEVVVSDERELGDRALLNLGHTFGHAIEAGLGYGTWLHGEAVAAGTMMAAELSRELGNIDGQDVARIEKLFGRTGLPVRGPRLAPKRYLELMRHDKKVRDGKLRLVLLERVGKATVTDRASDQQIVKAIDMRSENA